MKADQRTFSLWPKNGNLKLAPNRPEKQLARTGRLKMSGIKIIVVSQSSKRDFSSATSLCSVWAKVT